MNLDGEPRDLQLGWRLSGDRRQRSYRRTGGPGQRQPPLLGLSCTRYNRAIEDFIPRDRRYDDRHCVAAPAGSCQPNPPGLYDMHGNVSEWTRSDYGADGTGTERKVVRGGSVRDRLRKARASWGWGYYPFQPVFDVGFRVVRTVEDDKEN